MRIKIAGLLIAMNALLSAVTIDIPPVQIIPTPDSILEHKEDYLIAAVGPRQRYATSTSTAWFHGQYLAILNLYGQALRIYHVDMKSGIPTLIQEISNKDGAMLNQPEHMSVSPDERFLVMCDARSRRINIYCIQKDSHTLDPIPCCSIIRPGLIHNVRFSPNGNYIAYASFDSEQSLCIYRWSFSEKQGTLTANRIYPNTDILKAKAVYFSPDGRFIVIAYSYAITDVAKFGFKSTLMVKQFDQERGIVGKTVDSVTAVCSIEDICFCNQGNSIIATDQGHDRLLIFDFNQKTGAVHLSKTVEGKETNLSFPHGLSVSKDNRFLAVANYGTDITTLYALS